MAVTNPENQSRGIRSATLDGDTVDPSAIPLHDDGKIHDVVIVLGAAAALAAHPAAAGPAEQTR